jgi:trehalose-6-phosphate synthase
MRRAIEMPRDERIERHGALMKCIRQHDACNWMRSFLRALRACRGHLRANICAELAPGCEKRLAG